MFGFCVAKHFQQRLLSYCLYVRPHSAPRRVTERATKRNKVGVCEGAYALFSTQHVTNKTGTIEGLGDVRHRLCPKLPLPLNTHKLSFLIETFHSLPCKHPVRPAGARTICTSPPQCASKDYY